MEKFAVFVRSVGHTAITILTFLLGSGFSTAASAQSPSLKEQVFATERAFAKTMEKRDLAAFAEFLAEETIFFNGVKEPLRGKQKVIAEWAKYYKETNAPFSWEPDQVEVLASGTLALTTGPVKDPEGNVFARFNSIWRLEGPNKWRIIFDKGGPASPGPQ
jgi:ketosteroid isomerase-like protein